MKDSSAFQYIAIDQIFVSSTNPRLAARHAVTYVRWLNL
jgi:hypothetical protein